MRMVIFYWVYGRDSWVVVVVGGGGEGLWLECAKSYTNRSVKCSQVLCDHINFWCLYSVGDGLWLGFVSSFGSNCLCLCVRVFLCNIYSSMYHVYGISLSSLFQEMWKFLFSIIIILCNICKQYQKALLSWQIFKCDLFNLIINYSKGFDLKRHVSIFEKYDNWTANDYKLFQGLR